MKLRFDDAYGKVYMLEDNEYVFVGSYVAFGIVPKMSVNKKYEIVINDPCWLEDE